MACIGSYLKRFIADEVDKSDNHGFDMIDVSALRNDNVIRDETEQW